MCCISDKARQDFNCYSVALVFGVYTTTFLFAYLDENWRRLSRPRRTMTRAMARLPRIMWGRRFTLQRSFSSFQRRSWQSPSPPRQPPPRSPRLLKPPRPQIIVTCLAVTRGERIMPRVIAAWNITSRLEVESSTWHQGKFDI